MRRKLSVLFIMILASLNVMAYDFSAENEDGKTLYYNITSTSLKTAEVTSNPDDLYDGDIVIPATAADNNVVYSVTGIADRAFENCTELTSVVIDESVTRIGNFAFKGCEELTSIIVPNVTISFGTNILENCTSLVSFDVPRYMTSIPEAFFKGCTSLTTITTTNSLISISWQAFEGCTALTSASFVIPGSVVSIGYSAFKGCTGLTSVTIPSGVMKIDNDTFKNCTNLSIVTLPNTLNEIKSYAFRDCVSLETINFPTSLTRIGIYAFSGCTSLETVDMSLSGVNYIDEYAFEGCTMLDELIFSNTISYLGAYAFGNCTELSYVEIPRSMTTIGAQAFIGCSGLEEVILPSTTISIGAEAFKDCSNLEVLRCYAKIPPMAGSNNCFEGVPTDMMVYVPCSAIETYMSMTPWNQFTIWCDPNINIVVDVAPNESCGYINGDGDFTTDETVTLIATPRPHYVFVNWTEDDEVVSTSPMYSFVALEDRFLTANFEFESYDIVALAEPAAYGRALGGGEYQYGDVARLEAYPNEHYEFYSWTENDSVVCNEPTYRFTVPYARTLVAHFEPMVYNVTTSLNIADAGETTGDGDYVYNTPVTVTTTGYEHYNFSCWKEYGEVVSTNQTYTFNIDRNRNLVATYIPDDFEIIADVLEEETGTVEGAGIYPYHTIATLVATPAEHYHFAGWLENDTIIVSTDATYSFQVTGNRYLTAVFELNNYIVTASSNMPGMGVVYGQGTYPAGTRVTMSVYPYIHSIFNYWTENGEIVTSSPSFSFNIESNRNFVANFSVEDNHHWIPNNTLYPYTMMLTCVVQIDGEDITSNQYEVGAFCGDEVRGSQRAQFVNSTGRFLVYMTIYGNNDDQITFKLYDHESNTVLDLECLSTITFVQDQFIGTTNDPYILNFVSELFITVNANPTSYGTVTGSGPCNFGDEITVTATANPGYTFYNWTENGNVVSTNSVYTFIAEGSRALTANFGVGNHWIPVTTPQTMDLMGVIEICGVEQRNDSLEVGAFCGNIVRGSQMPLYIESIDRYIVLMTIYGNDGEELTFKLYDHRTGLESEYVAGQTLTFLHNTAAGTVLDPYVLNFAPAVEITAVAMPDFAGTVTGAGMYQVGSEVTLVATGTDNYAFVNWSVNGNIVSTEPVYTFTASESVNFVAHFDHGQNTDLVEGWNWYSTYIEMNGIDGLGMIKDRLAGKATYIRSSTQYIEYANNEWNGTLTRIVNEKMYSINMTEDYTLSIHGIIADPNNHPITLAKGWSWIGYPVHEELEINEALSNLHATTGDVFKSMENYAEYNDSTGWVGSLTTLVPGQGYMYNNCGNTAKSFIYHTADTNQRSNRFNANVTTKDNHWVPNVHKYPFNMCVTAIIKLDGYDQSDKSFEVGAFNNGECRGSARPIFVEQLNRYLTFITVYGDDDDEIIFKLYDTSTGEVISEQAENIIYFSTNMMVGSSTNAYELEFNNMLNVDNNNIFVGIYPNPSKIGEGVLLTTSTENSKVLVFNALGTMIYETTFNDEVRLNCFPQSGVYFIKVMTSIGEAYRKIIID